MCRFRQYFTAVLDQFVITSEGLSYLLDLSWLGTYRYCRPPKLRTGKDGHIQEPTDLCLSGDLIAMGGRFVSS